MASAIKQRAFNRAASSELGAGASLNKYLIVGLSAAKKKFITRIFASCNVSGGPAVVQSYIAKLCICSSPGNLENDASLIAYNVLNQIGSEQLDLGTKYYEQVITLPLTFPIEFNDLPIEDGEAVYVVLSFPYANGESLLAPATKNAYLSVEGYYQQDNTNTYKYR